jgi:hypothetical protein
MYGRVEVTRRVTAFFVAFAKASDALAAARDAQAGAARIASAGHGGRAGADGPRHLGDWSSRSGP